MTNRDTAMPTLRFAGIAKRFGGTLAIDDVTLDVNQGEIVALLGENGAGKSTLIKVLAGIHRPDAGELLWEGRPLKQRQAEAEGQLIAFIHQDLGLIDWMTIAENIAFGTGFPRRLGLIDWKEAERRTTEVLATVGCDLAPGRRIHSLSRTEKSLVAIARALSVHARLIVLDEPTASLPASDVARLLTVLRGLRDRGVAIIYVTHRLDEVIQLADRAAVMRDGRLVGAVPLAETNHRHLVEMIIGRPPDISDSDAPNSGGPRVGDPARPRNAPTLLQLDKLVAGEAGPVDLTLGRGEILGLVGLRGGGQESVGRALFGVTEVTSGSIRLQGKVIAPTSPKAAIACGISFVAADRLDENLAPGMSVQENLFLNPPSSGGLANLLHRIRGEGHSAQGLIGRFDVRPRAAGAVIESLSGGNQQKVVLARWLTIGSPLLILEEPTAGVDVGAKAEIYRLLRIAAAEGIGILVVSTDIEEITHLCRRALVFRNGRIAAELAGTAITEAALLSAASAGPSTTTGPVGIPVTH